jgi:hypothetical protein
MRAACVCVRTVGMRMGGRSARLPPLSPTCASMHPSLHDTYLLTYLILFIPLLWARFLLFFHAHILIITVTNHPYIHFSYIQPAYIHLTNITQVNNIQPTGNTNRGFFDSSLRCARSEGFHIGMRVWLRFFARVLSSSSNHHSTSSIFRPIYPSGGLVTRDALERRQARALQVDGSGFVQEDRKYWRRLLSYLLHARLKQNGPTTFSTCHALVYNPRPHRDSI